MNTFEIQEAIKKQQALLQQLQAQLEESKKEKEALVISFAISKTNIRKLFLRTNVFREDFIDLLRKIPSRVWHPVGKYNSIDIDDYPSLIIAAVGGLEKCSVAFEEGVEDTIDKLLNAPSFIISFTEGQLKVAVKSGTKMDWEMREFFPNLYSYENVLYKDFSIPIVHASRFLDTLQKSNLKYQWHEDSMRAFYTLMDKKMQLASISIMESSPSYSMQLGDYTLRGFQEVGVNFLDLTDGNAIIGDEPGLGKSIQAVAYAVLKNKRILIICPAALKENWRRYIIAYTGKTPRVFKGIEPTMVDIEDLTIPGKKSQFNIMHYDMFSRPSPVQLPNGDRTNQCLWVPWINMSSFDSIVFDEVHKIKNMDAARTKEAMRLKASAFTGLSGTPVQNHPEEFFPILHLIAPKEFPTFRDFHERFVEDKFNVRNKEVFREILASIMIRRKKDQVMKDLPPITRTDHYVEITPTQQAAYNQILQGVFLAIDSAYRVYGNLDGSAITNILTEILRLKQYLASLKTEDAAEMAQEFYSQTESAHKKVIIFSQFKPVVADIARRLGEHAVTFDGDVDPLARQKIVDQFQTDPNIHYLVCTVQTAQEGLNITAAGLVLFVDMMWTPAIHEQAEGRAYGRLNDPHPIESRYLVVAKTIEERIKFILLNKLAMITSMVDGIEVERVKNSSMASELISYLRTLR